MSETMPDSQIMRAIRSIDPTAVITWSEYTGQFYVEAKIDISDGSVLTRCAEHRADPSEALRAYWQRIKTLTADETVAVRAGSADSREFRWTGFLWAEVWRDKEGSIWPLSMKPKETAETKEAQCGSQ